MVNASALVVIVEGGGSESCVSYRGVMKAGFDADVELLIAALEPATAAGAKRFRLLDFTQAEKKAVKFTSGGFAALRHRKLNVVDTRD